MALRCLFGHRWVLCEAKASLYGPVIFERWVPMAVLECARCRARKTRTIGATILTYEERLPTSREAALAWCRGQARTAVPDTLPESFTEASG